jgi:hypothetical protein
LQKNLYVIKLKVKLFTQLREIVTLSLISYFIQQEGTHYLL